MANEQDLLLNAAFSLDASLVEKLAKSEICRNEAAESMPEDMTTVPDDRHVAASREGPAEHAANPDSGVDRGQ